MSDITSYPINGARPMNMLAKVLFADAVFSGLSAVLLVVAAVPLAAMIGAGVPSWLLIGIGLGLLPWAFLHWRLAGTSGPISKAARRLAWGDALWVIASINLLWLYGDQLSGFGYWAIAAIAVVVAEFGISKIYFSRNHS